MWSTVEYRNMQVLEKDGYGKEKKKWQVHSIITYI